MAPKMGVTALQVAKTWIGVREDPGPGSDPLVLGMIRLFFPNAPDDSFAWCGIFPALICRQLGLPIPDAPWRARNWLTVGRRILLVDATPGWDLVVLSRGPMPQPGPDVLEGPGHVTWFWGYYSGLVTGLGGNQSNAVMLTEFLADRVLAVQRLWEP